MIVSPFLVDFCHICMEEKCNIIMVLLAFAENVNDCIMIMIKANISHGMADNLLEMLSPSVSTVYLT